MHRTVVVSAVGGMRIVEARDRDAVSRLRDVWRGLQARCEEATPYQTWEWNAAWWTCFGARKCARILLFYTEGNDQPVGIAPLYTSRHLNTPIRRLAWIGTGQSDYLGLLAQPEHQSACAAALLRYMERSMRGWDMADLQQLREESALACSGRPWPGRPARFQALLPSDPCPYLALPATWPEYTARLGKSMRSNLRYYARLIEKEFESVRYRLATEETLDGDMSALFDLHQKRWNARWLPGALGGKRVQAFHRDVARRFAEQGWLRLHLLEIDGSPVAALYCFRRGKTTYYYLGGFAPDLAKYSLGTLLTGHAIETAIAEGDMEFDFLRGAEPYKYRWMPQERTNQRLLLLRQREGLGGLGLLPGRAGLAMSHVERYVVRRAKAFAAQKGNRGSGC